LIARLEGRLAEKKPEGLVLDVNGVGYEVRVPLSTFLELPDEGKTVRLQIHTYVREEALHLYGFLTEEERSAFGLLLGTSGVGPRLAISILSGLPVGRLVEAVRRGDITALRGVPGVGLKTAERIVVDLRDKVGQVEMIHGASPSNGAEEATVSALLNLGYPRTEAENAVRRARETLGDSSALEDLIREALRAVTR
jgi:Holliday junction DNA helicase RuvA